MVPVQIPTSDLKEVDGAPISDRRVIEDIGVRCPVKGRHVEVAFDVSSEIVAEAGHDVVL
ncbi:MAG: hypothetical protein CMJ54_01600 [Planctomycetaceae bacterium]|nr:hypothetical protein [Planctomycetaceae bacterium]